MSDNRRLTTTDSVHNTPRGGEYAAKSWEAKTQTKKETCESIELVRFTSRIDRDEQDEFLHRSLQKFVVSRHSKFALSYKSVAVLFGFDDTCERPLSARRFLFDEDCISRLQVG